jgi:membrane fusion protein, heavy metal efflux system
LEFFMRFNSFCAPFGVCIAAYLLSHYTLAADAAAAPTNAVEFSVPQAQLRVMGIQTAPLQKRSTEASAQNMSASYPGTITVPLNAQRALSAPLAGMVEQLLVEQNQIVQVGTPLVVIASPELGELQLRLLQSSSRANLARQALVREQQLFKEGIIAQRRVTEASAAKSERDAALNQAKTALRLAGMSNQSISRVLTTGNPQDRITLSATQAGVVMEINVEPGERVMAATALLHVAQTRNLLVEIQVPGAANAQWPIGTRVSLRGLQIGGQIVSQSHSVVAGSQTATVRARLDETAAGKTPAVRPGEFVTVEVAVPAEQADGVAVWNVPLAAVVRDGAQAVVFVRTATGFAARPVQVQSSAGQNVLVQGTLMEGEQIAISGLVALKGAWLSAKSGEVEGS